MQVLQSGCLQKPYLLAIVSVWAVEELDTGEGAGQFASTRDPVDGGALIKQVGWVEKFDALLLNHAHSQHLALLLVRDQLCWQHL